MIKDQACLEKCPDLRSSTRVAGKAFRKGDAAGRVSDETEVNWWFTKMSVNEKMYGSKKSPSRLPPSRLALQAVEKAENRLFGVTKVYRRLPY